MSECVCLLCVLLRCVLYVSDECMYFEGGGSGKIENVYLKKKLLDV